MQPTATCSVCGQPYKPSYGGCTHCGAVCSEVGVTELPLTRSDRTPNSVLRKGPQKLLAIGFAIGAIFAILGLYAQLNAPVVEEFHQVSPTRSAPVKVRKTALADSLMFIGGATWVGSLCIFWIKKWVHRASEPQDPNCDPRVM